MKKYFVTPVIVAIYLNNAHLSISSNIYQFTFTIKYPKISSNLVNRNVRVPEMWRQSTALYTGYWAAGWQNQWLSP